MPTADEMTIKPKVFADETEKLDLNNPLHVQWVLGGLELGAASVALNKPDMLHVIASGIIARIEGDGEKVKEVDALMAALVESIKPKTAPVL